MCLAIPGKIISISGGNLSDLQGRVGFSDIVKEISLAYVPEAQVGDYIIVHAGFAISILDQHEARAVFKEISAFNQLQQNLSE